MEAVRYRPPPTFFRIRLTGDVDVELGVDRGAATVDHAARIRDRAERRARAERDRGGRESRPEPANAKSLMQCLPLLEVVMSNASSDDEGRPLQTALIFFFGGAMRRRSAHDDHVERRVDPRPV